MTAPERVPDLAVLFPVRAWLRHPAVRAWPTWGFVALVGVPPAALALFPAGSGLFGLAILLAAYVAAVWFLVPGWPSPGSGSGSRSCCTASTIGRR